VFWRKLVISALREGGVATKSEYNVLLEAARAKDSFAAAAREAKPHVADSTVKSGARGGIEPPTRG